MTPNEHLEKLRLDYLKEIELFFTENNMKEIEFEPEENDLDIEPIVLTDSGILTLVNKFGNDYDEKLNTLPVQIVAHILTLIHLRRFDIV
jgi:hypothetical protein